MISVYIKQTIIINFVVNANAVCYCCYMGMEANNNLKKNVTNFFGAFGYLSCLSQWLWAIALNFSFIESIALFVSPVADSPVIEAPKATIDISSNMPLMIMAIFFVVIMAALTIFVLVKMPSTIVKTGKKVVHGASEGITPIVLKLQHKKDNKKNHKKLSSRLVLIIKIILIIIPVGLSIMSGFSDAQLLDSYISIIICLWLAGFSLVFFVIQYLLARFFALSRQDIL